MYSAGSDSLILLLSHFNKDLKVIIMLVARKKSIISRAREKPTVYNETRILLSMKIFIVVNAVNYSELLSLLISNNMFISLALIQTALRHTVFSVFVTRFV